MKFLNVKEFFNLLLSSIFISFFIFKISEYQKIRFHFLFLNLDLAYIFKFSEIRFPFNFQNFSEFLNAFKFNFYFNFFILRFQNIKKLDFILFLKFRFSLHF